MTQLRAGLIAPKSYHGRIIMFILSSYLIQFIGNAPAKTASFIMPDISAMPCNSFLKQIGSLRIRSQFLHISISSVNKKLFNKKLSSLLGLALQDSKNLSRFHCYICSLIKQKFSIKDNFAHQALLDNIWRKFLML